MPIAMPSPTGTNKANQFLPDTFYGDNPVAAYDSKHGLQRDDHHRSRRLEWFLKTKLAADDMRALMRIIAEDAGEEAPRLSDSDDDLPPWQKLSDLLNRTLKGEDLSQAVALLKAIGNPDNPDAAEDDDRDDQPPPFKGRPDRDADYAKDSRSRLPKSPLFAEDNSQGVVKNVRTYLSKIQVLG